MVTIMVFMFVGYVRAGVQTNCVYCQDMGFDSEVVTASDGGQHSVCIFPDGEMRRVNFLEGLCGQSHSYCAQHGLNLY
jgi:putative hemolysin